MPHAEWDVPHSLITPQGNLLLNQLTTISGTSTGSGIYLLKPDACSIATLRRPEGNKDDIPQDDGSTLHRRYETGVVAKLVIQFWLTRRRPACDSDLRCMIDNLDVHTRSLLNADGPYRLRWEPSGYGDERMVDQFRLLDWSPVRLQGPVREQELLFDSPFPYAIDLTQQGETIPNGDSLTITMIGTTAFKPVMKIHANTGQVTITNATTGRELIYDDSLPGAPAITGSDYVEVDFFRGTAYLNGNDANRKLGIDIRQSRFFDLEVGPNEIEVSGADVDVLWNNSWW